MSVSRNVLRLIATCVASGALVGAAALPALADGRSHPHSYRPHTVVGDYDHSSDRARGWGRHHGWHRGPHHGHDRFGNWGPRRHHGWFFERQRHHNHYAGHR